MRRWVSQETLFELVRSRFPDARSQWRPKWLSGLSVDIFVPSLNVAFEYQGVQHFRSVPRFGGEEGFRNQQARDARNQQARDARKRRLLTSQGVALVEWWFKTPIVDAELDRALASVMAAWVPTR
jgi:hypothetical protein